MTTFTDSRPHVDLVPLSRGGLQVNAWCAKEPGQMVLVIRCNQPDQPSRLGMPTRGYLVRAGDDVAWSDIYYVTSQAAAARAAEQLLMDRVPDARMMLTCLNNDCEYWGVGIVPFMWDEDEDDWACPKCRRVG